MTLNPTLHSDLIAFAQGLVRAKSLSGQEGDIARLIAAQMQALDFDSVTIDRYGSVLGRVGSGATRILFDSHMDTVEVTDAEAWRVPPFSGEIKDGWLWGRGAVDMKSGLAALLHAAALAKRQGLLDGKSVYVSCTVDEEYCDGVSLQYLLEGAQLTPDYAVVCEPSSNTIVTGHRGKAQIIITTRGVSAHGSAPEKGVNAIYEMAEIIQRVEQFNLALMRSGGGTLVMSHIASQGVSLNAVPSACKAYLDRRLVAGETEETVRAEMARITAGKDALWEVDTLRRATWTGEELVYHPLHPAWRIQREHPLARAFAGALEAARGTAPEDYGFWDFSTNAVALVRMGVPVIGFGPGESKLAHMRDERCPVEQISEACEVYVGVIRRL